MIPILCYILSKANPPSIRSQWLFFLSDSDLFIQFQQKKQTTISCFISEFVNETLAMGQEGYAIATLETVLDFLDSQDKSK